MSSKSLETIKSKIINNKGLFTPVVHMSYDKFKNEASFMIDKIDYILNYRLMPDEKQVSFSVYNTDHIDFYEGRGSIDTLKHYLPFKYKDDIKMLQAFIDNLFIEGNYSFLKSSQEPCLIFRIHFFNDYVYEKFELNFRHNFNAEIQNLKHLTFQLKDKLEEKEDMEAIDQKLLNYQNVVFSRLDQITQQIKDIKEKQKDSMLFFKEELNKLSNKVDYVDNNKKVALEDLMRTIELDYNNSIKRVQDNTNELLYGVIFGFSALNSKLISNEKLDFLHEHFSRNNSMPKFSLIYSTEIHGDSSYNFHRLCDSRFPTLTIVKDTYDHVFGGYTTIPWSSKECWRCGDVEAFLFSAGKKKIIKHDNDIDKCSIYCHVENGPTFGGGNDLCIASDCKSNKKSYCSLKVSFGNKDKDVDVYYLTNGKKFFKVADYEVYQVEFEDHVLKEGPDREIIDEMDEMNQENFSSEEAKHKTYNSNEDISSIH